jgi:hypothetical protein
MWWLLACADEPAPVVVPEVHGWKEEGELVVDGLEEVERLWRAGQKEAARTLAERVYTERFEPRLEPALVRAKGDLEAMRMEHAFGMLFVELEGRGQGALARIATLEEDVRGVANAAAAEFPTAPGVGAPAVPQAAEGSTPIVPDVRPAWDAPTTTGAAAEGGAPAAPKP